MTKILKAV